MKRIFLSLVTVGMLLLGAAFWLGLDVGDLHVASDHTRKTLSLHLLVSVAALIFAALVHAVLLTYFMGTSRWLEETAAAYKLEPRWVDENRALKYRTIPWLAFCLALLIANIPLGALSVDSGDWTLPALGTVSRSHVHLVFAVLTVVVNLAVNVLEYRAIRRNGQLIAEVVAEVRHIREAHGLSV